eukprot:comp20645_c0_seq1/m.26746 comp20645_c0_seq1/g.26746  ORF comp20645_c0_seq1/g.26746 comp20645_c0_seq1/m.26746 type:complete len:437 (-) comp20645_c0_seq1:8-1318(-)
MDSSEERTEEGHYVSEEQGGEHDHDHGHYSEQHHDSESGFGGVQASSGIKRIRNKKGKRCANCGTDNTPFFRNIKSERPDGTTVDRLLCNSCGLYYRRHHKDRPVDLYKDYVPTPRTFRKKETTQFESDLKALRALKNQWPAFPTPVFGENNVMQGGMYGRPPPKKARSDDEDDDSSSDDPAMAPMVAISESDDSDGEGEGAGEGGERKKKRKKGFKSGSDDESGEGGEGGPDYGQWPYPAHPGAYGYNYTYVYLPMSAAPFVEKLVPWDPSKSVAAGGGSDGESWKNTPAAALDSNYVSTGSKPRNYRAAAKAAGGLLPADDGRNRQCQNCGVRATHMWRKSKYLQAPGVEEGGKGPEVWLCNACGIYETKSMGQQRPLAMIKKDNERKEKLRARVLAERQVAGEDVGSGNEGRGSESEEPTLPAIKNIQDPGVS